MTESLFSPYELGPYRLSNRIVMAPMTRSRAEQPGNIPSRLNAIYYAQRASAGLIVTEGAQISPQGQGYPWTPGIHTAEQIEGWRTVADEVHAAGGHLFLQLWHVGRISHPFFQPKGELPVAPSAITPAGEAFILNEQGQPAMVPFVTPRALELSELPEIINQYVQASKNALSAGIDGVEIHAANGYLLDQFISSGTNQRNDAYGGSIENRIRLLLEVTDAVSRVCGAERVGVRISPFGTFNDMSDEDPEALFEAIADALSSRGLGYLHIVDPTFDGEASIRSRGQQLMTSLRYRFAGTLILCGGYDRSRADTALKEGRADLIGFGRPFISNPDLPMRLETGAPLTAPDPTLFYGGGIQGYVDYPTREQEIGVEPRPDFSAFVN
jgi:N-ethylmaleimide reductase